MRMPAAEGYVGVRDEPAIRRSLRQGRYELNVGCLGTEYHTTANRPRCQPPFQQKENRHDDNRPCRGDPSLGASSPSWTQLSSDMAIFGTRPETRAHIVWAEVVRLPLPLANSGNGPLLPSLPRDLPVGCQSTR
jgi:hypothetical protein